MVLFCCYIESRRYLSLHPHVRTMSYCFAQCSKKCSDECITVHSECPSIHTRHKYWSTAQPYRRISHLTR